MISLIIIHLKILTRINALEANKSIHLYGLLNAIDVASRNNNIEGIILDMQNYISPGSASAKEIRDALKKFKRKK